MSALKVSSVPTCCVCGKTILAGTGLYVSEPVRGVRFCHSGGCAREAGAFPGGGASIWGEIPSLMSLLVANDGMTLVAAAAAVRWRGAVAGEGT